MVADLRSTDDGELMLATPRGGWWSRGRLDIALGEVDRGRLRGVVRWRRDGLVIVEVDGRRPVQLWVADVRRLEQALADAGETQHQVPTVARTGQPDSRMSWLGHVLVGAPAV